METSGCDRDFVACDEAFMESNRGTVAALEGCQPERNGDTR